MNNANILMKSYQQSYEQAKLLKTNELIEL